MAVTLAQVRTQIADRPQLFPPNAQPPDLIGTGDGNATIFSLRYENYIPGTLTIYTATPPTPGSGSGPTWTAVSPSNYIVGSSNPGPNQTGATNAIITFNTAPAAGMLIGSRYQVTAFSDADLSGYLSRAQALYTDDYLVLKRVQFDIIDVLLVDRERLLIVAQGDYREDPASYEAALHQIKESLRIDLEGGPQAGTNIPALSIGKSQAGRYQPLR